MVLRFERRDEELLPLRAFYRRLLKFALISLSIIVASLLAGVLGYMYFESMMPVDAFLNAAMIMGGMGPATPLFTDGGKLFAGFYALYCGFILLVAAGIFVTPIFHRFLHHFHLEGKKGR
jgi:hypothetical protein